MLEPNNTNNINTDNYYDLDKDHGDSDKDYGADFDISPNQLNLFEEKNESEKINFDVDDATYMDIKHESKSDINSVLSQVNENLEEEDDDEETDEDEVTTSTKLKIIATLIIIGLAGYAAYWVQEPVQIKADVLGSDIESQADSEENLVSEKLVSETNEDNGEKSTDLTKTSPQNSVSVDMSAFGFEPVTLNITPGTTVVWTNTSSEDQTIVGSSDNGESFVSPVLSSGDSFNYTFENSDKFEYYSTFNPTTKANIVVENSNSDSFMQEDLEAFPDAFEFVDEASSPVEENLKPSAEENIMLINDNSEQNTDNIMAENNEELRPAADENTPNNLAKTGPAETLYVFILFVSLWINRKKLAKVFNK